MAISQQEFSSALSRRKNYEALKKIENIGLTYQTSVALIKLGILHDRILKSKGEYSFVEELMEIIEYHTNDDFKMSSSLVAEAQGEIEFLFGFDWNNPSLGKDVYSEKSNAFFMGI